MGRRRTNVLLLLLTLGAMGTGVLAFALGTRWALAAVVAHGVVSLGLVVSTPWKWRIVRRGMGVRSVTSTWPSVLLGVLVVVTVLTGLLHSTGLVLRYGPFDDMQVHVVAAVAATLLTIWHVLARGDAPGRTDLSRRNVLRAGLVLGTAGVGFLGLEGLTRIADLPGARRRFTGSYERGSHDPPSMPSIIWLTDPRPDIDPQDWHVDIDDANGSRRLGHADLQAFHDEVVATIDCTVGWYAEQMWHGVRLERLVDVPPDARSVVVRSVTGYARRFAVDDVPHLLLATGYGGLPLAPRHGFPLRLVAPGRRGFWWVKWVTGVETSTHPWWWQPYFPLQ